MDGGKVNTGILLPLSGKTLNGGLGRMRNGGQMSRGIKVGIRPLQVGRVGRKLLHGRKAHPSDRVLDHKGLATDLVLIQIAMSGLIILFIILSRV